MSTLCQLPESLFAHHIVLYLPAPDIFQLLRVNRFFRNCHFNRDLWKFLCLRDLPEFDDSLEHKEVDWHRQYVCPMYGEKNLAAFHPASFVLAHWTQSRDVKQGIRINLGACGFSAPLFIGKLELYDAQARVGIRPLDLYHHQQAIRTRLFCGGTLLQTSLRDLGMYFKHLDGVFLCFDVHDADSLRALRKFARVARTACPRLCFFLIGITSSDPALPNPPLHQVSRSQALALAHELNSSGFLEVDLTTGHHCYPALYLLISAILHRRSLTHLPSQHGDKMEKKNELDSQDPVRVIAKGGPLFPPFKWKELPHVKPSSRCHIL
eukprot:TRINITY_DN4168_c0_g1_i4.p1 TRINITY_DN4168_c0_g1~~TRINITY_DN4168_c0_g1_i4.p1  ORF type:complete len:323 (+),score=4.54 TRINITY_DN4168_c0_g1_i4:39-1007(+)